MYYHATKFKDIKILEPRVSNHGKPFVYFSEKRENVLVYLSNAIEKYCKETNFKHDKTYTPWGPYGFGKDEILELTEYYPNAIYETYKGVSGYIYYVQEIKNIEKLKDIPFAYVSKEKITIDSVEYINDAYEEIIKAEKDGKIRIVKYEELTKEKKDWLKNTIINEYQNSINKPEYRYFLENKFSFIQKNET